MRLNLSLQQSETAGVQVTIASANANPRLLNARPAKAITQSLTSRAEDANS
jgi:hypothetical protein